MDNPWYFFKDVYVISLKTAIDRREALSMHLARFDGLQYTVVEAINGRKNCVLRNWFEIAKFITTPYNFSDGALGCLASHRKIWQITLESIESKFPVWVLIMEDDVRFHSFLTNEIMKAYLENIPSDARVLKFGYLSDPENRGSYTRENKYWWNFNATGAFSNICYAVRADVLPTFLYTKINCPVDGITMKGMYGAASLEEAFGIVETDEHMKYFNPYTGKNMVFQGIVGVADYGSTTV